jgi:hypothetical protein
MLSETGLGMSIAVGTKLGPYEIRSKELIDVRDNKQLALYFTCKHHCLQDVGWLADYRLGFQVLFQPENSAFPTNSRLFEPAEGGERIVAY